MAFISSHVFFRHFLLMRIFSDEIAIQVIQVPGCYIILCIFRSKFVKFALFVSMEASKKPITHVNSQCEL